MYYISIAAGIQITYNSHSVNQSKEVLVPDSRYTLIKAMILLKNNNVPISKHESVVRAAAYELLKSTDIFLAYSYMSGKNREEFDIDAWKFILSEPNGRAAILRNAGAMGACMRLDLISIEDL